MLNRIELSGLGLLRRLLSDPLFLKTPKGVVPTELSEPIADILARVRNVISPALRAAS